MRIEACSAPLVVMRVKLKLVEMWCGVSNSILKCSSSIILERIYAVAKESSR